MRIRDCCRGELASDYQVGARNHVTFSPTICEEIRDRLFRHSMDDVRPSVCLLRVGFEFSHGGVVWLARLGKSWIAQIDHSAVAQPRRINRTGKKHNSCPAGFESKTESRGFR